MALTAPQKNNLSEIWTEIDLMCECGLPPLKQNVLLCDDDNKRLKWYKFADVKQRRYVCSTGGYTHWRGELKVDFP